MIKRATRTTTKLCLNASSAKVTVKTMNRKTAEELVSRFEEINRLIFSILPEFEERLSSEEFEFLKREVARMGVMADTHVYPVLLKQSPDLNPLNDNG